MEIGRFDIILEISLLYRYLAQPRRGHLDQAFHVFSYINSQYRSKIALDTHENDSDGKFVDHDWQ